MDSWCTTCEGGEHEQMCWPKELASGKTLGISKYGRGVDLPIRQASLLRGTCEYVLAPETLHLRALGS